MLLDHHGSKEIYGEQHDDNDGADGCLLAPLVERKEQYGREYVHLHIHAEIPAVSQALETEEKKVNLTCMLNLTATYNFLGGIVLHVEHRPEPGAFTSLIVIEACIDQGPIH